MTFHKAVSFHQDRYGIGEYNIEKRKEEIGWIYDKHQVFKGNELARALGDIENYIFDMLEEKQYSVRDAIRALKAFDNLFRAL